MMFSIQIFVLIDEKILDFYLSFLQIGPTPDYYRTNKSRAYILETKLDLLTPQDLYLDRPMHSNKNEVSCHTENHPQVIWYYVLRFRSILDSYHTDSQW